MVEVRFHLSGSLLFKTKAEFIPSDGTIAIITTEAYKSGLEAGSIIQVEVGKLEPVEVEYNSDGSIVAHVSVNGYETLREGPKEGSILE